MIISITLKTFIFRNFTALEHKNEQIHFKPRSIKCNYGDTAASSNYLEQIVSTISRCTAAQIELNSDIPFSSHYTVLQ